MVSYTQQWYSDISAKNINGKRCSQTHQTHDNVEDHKYDEDDCDDNCDNNKYDVNEDKIDTVAHTFIVFEDTWSTLLTNLLIFYVLMLLSLLLSLLWCLDIQKFIINSWWEDAG